MSKNNEVIINSYAFIHAGKPTLVYSTGKATETGISGNIFLNTDGKCTQITKKTGDYDNVKAISLNNKIYLIYTQYETGQNTIVFKEIDGSEIKLTYAGKFFNPDAVADGSKITVVWENQENGDSVLEFINIDIGTLTASDVNRITPEGCRCYCPSIVNDGQRLVLGYERFDNSCYIIELRYRKSGSNGFSKPVIVSLNNENDTSVKLCVSDGNVYFSWDNSSPLYKGDTWHEGHTGNTLIMPAFGHGWRVKGKICVGKLNGFDGYNPEIMVMPSGKNFYQYDESAGAAFGFMCGGVFYLLYMAFYQEKRLWRARLEYYTEDGFQSVEIPEILSNQRKIPATVICNDILYLATGYELAAVPLNAHKVNNEAMRFSSLPPYNPPKVENVMRGSVEIGGEQYNLYWGDLHMHSNISPCSRHSMFHCTDLTEKHRFSRDVGRLDYELLTDHDMMTDIEWEVVKKAANLADSPEHHVSFIGFEWTGSMFGEYPFHRFGHYNVLYRDDGKLYRVAENEYHDLEKLWVELKSGEVMTIPHHPGESIMYTDWNYYHPEFVRLVEIFQVRGSYEYDNCRMYPELYGRMIKKDCSVKSGLDLGYRFGFTSGGEHEGVGITGVYAKELTREAIFDALYNRRVFGATSPDCFIDFRVDDVFMGGIHTGGIPENLLVKVKNLTPVSAIVLVTPGKEIVLAEPNSSDCSYGGSVPFDEVVGWAYVRVEMADGNTAWSSPVFFDF